MTTQNRMPYAEQKRRGEAIYNAQIRHRIVSEDAGKFVLVDVLSGDYEIDYHAADAIIRLLKRRPDAITHEIRNHKTYVGQMLNPRRIVHKTKAAR